MKHLFLFLFSLFTVAVGSAQNEIESELPHFIWSHDTEEERLQVAFFRRSFHLEQSNVKEATMHLFADSRYHLLVNGTFVSFGPARFYPEHPEYDTVDLIPYLKKGENVIAVKVLSNGTSSFQLRRNQAGFAAWGTIQTEDKIIDLDTANEWKVYKVQGYDEYSAKNSFALGPMEVYDARLDPGIQGWESPAYDDSDWKRPIPIVAENHWGKFKPRSIPPLTNTKILPRELLGMYTLREEEDIYSFQCFKTDKTWNDFVQSASFVGYTFIHSEKEQEVEVGIWWGEHFLNGEGPLQQSDSGRPHRQKMSLNLKEGWNYFYVHRKSFFGKWAFQLAIPKTAGLVLSPNKSMDDKHFFMVAGPLEVDEKIIRTWNPSTIPSTEGKAWKAINREAGGNPAIAMAWRYFGEQLEVRSGQRNDLTVPPSTGKALVYDFRYKKLGRISIEYDAPEGTVIDLGFSEDLQDQQPNIMKRAGLYMAARHICEGGKGRFETIKPYGLRYLQLNIYNHSSPVKIKEVAVHQQVYPFQKKGEFTCSDPVLNDIWELGWRTLEVCAEDSYTDTPFRERGLYAGDLLPQVAITMVGSGDLRLVKRSLRLLQDMYADLFQPAVEKHPDEIGLLEDYPLLTLEVLRWYAQYTQDWAFVEEVLPAFDHMLQGYLARRNEQGLIHNETVFIEWTSIEKKQVNNTAFHAMLARSCMGLAQLFQTVGNEDRSNYYLKEKRRLQQAINSQLWDANRQLYADGLKEGELIDNSYPISNIWPYLAGITDSTQEGSIFPYVLQELKDIGDESRKRKATPYGAFYLLAALYEQGYAKEAEQFILKHWSPMVYRHNDTAWENFDDTGIGTLSHAWSGSPTYFLSTQILGVDLGWMRPMDMNEIVIAPQAESVDWARGKIPHPMGEIELFWEVRGSQLWVECEVPDDLKWSVQPKGRLAKLNLWVNGNPVK